MPSPGKTVSPAVARSSAWGLWTVPATWRAIDLLSDLHLCEATPRTAQALLRHVEASDADAVLLLGDVFEVWIGDDHARAAFESTLLADLAKAAQGRWLGMLHGNRDFLFGSRARALAGMHLLPEPTLMSAFGHRVLLSHGDALCVADEAYQAFRRQVRALPWQAAFLAQPRVARERLARHIRQESQAHQAARGGMPGAADVDASLARGLLEQVGARVLIHGHTHRPGTHDLGGGKARHVLTDWDLEPTAAPPRAGVLRLDIQGLTHRPVQGPGVAAG